MSGDEGTCALSRCPVQLHVGLRARVLVPHLVEAVKAGDVRGGCRQASQRIFDNVLLVIDELCSHCVCAEHTPTSDCRPCTRICTPRQLLCCGLCGCLGTCPHCLSAYRSSGSRHRLAASQAEQLRLLVGVHVCTTATAARATSTKVWGPALTVQLASKPSAPRDFQLYLQLLRPEISSHVVVIDAPSLSEAR